MLLRKLSNGALQEAHDQLVELLEEANIDLEAGRDYLNPRTTIRSTAHKLLAVAREYNRRRREGTNVA